MLARYEKYSSELKMKKIPTDIYPVRPQILVKQRELTDATDADPGVGILRTQTPAVCLHVDAPGSTRRVDDKGLLRQDCVECPRSRCHRERQRQHFVRHGMQQRNGEDGIVSQSRSEGVEL